MTIGSIIGTLKSSSERKKARSLGYLFAYLNVFLFLTIHLSLAGSPLQFAEVRHVPL